MSTISFVKYQGAGNDFILIDDRNRSFPFYDHEFIRKLCHRKLGIGADGVILLAEDISADFRMRIFNSDGFEAESCGNGLRCLARFIQDLGFPQKKYQVRVGDRLVEVWYEDDLVAVDMGKPRGLELNIHTELGTVHFVDTGVPHIVHFVSDVDAIDLQTLGFCLRHHPKFQPRGVNVNIASVLPSGSFRARTFERGVEGETLACGTGALAIATIAKKIYHRDLPLHIDFKGGRLQIDERGGRLKMLGPAFKVYQGVCLRS